MNVTPLRPTRESHEGPGPHGPCRAPAIHGRFRSPRGGSGTMHGTFRLEHVRAGPGGLNVEGVIAGELFDGDGTHLGRGSRRQTLPARIDGPWGSRLPAIPAAGTAATIGPVEVDLMGFAVSINAVSVPTACAMGVCSHHDDAEMKEGS